MRTRAGVKRPLEHGAGRAALRVEDPAAAVEGGQARGESLAVRQQDHRRIEDAGADALEQIAAPAGAE
jgi:hypothetical protein